MSVSLFDHFALDVNMSANTSNDPTPLKYKPAAPVLRPLTHATFEPYRVQSIDVVGARAHGTPLVESGALASVKPPIPKYRPLLEPEIITRGKLSLEQLETVIYAGEQHSQLFEMTTYDKDGNKVEDLFRGGYLLADGAGVGKGRQLAGIIRDNRNQGRKRAVWLSLSELLINDARRDWCDIGGKPYEIQAWNKTNVKDKLEFKDGILFGTYGLLRSRSKKVVHNEETGKDDTVFYFSRLNQLLEALGPDFDGVIALDECHALINAAPKETNEDDNVSEPSFQGMAALFLQAALPKARIVYVSATAASRLDALAYAERMQLWGKGGAFTDRATFLKLVGDGGTSALEVVCRDLKAQGRMCARTLSYEGVRYQRLVHELDEKQIEQYNNHNQVCRAIQNGFNEELIRLGIGERLPGTLEIEAVRGANVGRRLGNWRGARLHADRQILMSLKMPSLIPFIEQQLAEGKSVVLQMTHTNQASLDRALDGMEEEESLDDIDLSHREKLVDFLKTSYPTGVYKVVPDPEKKGKKMAVPELDADGNQIQHAGAVKRRDELVAAVQKLVYPLPGLDDLFKHFGPEKIAEVTGRNKQMIWKRGADGELHSEIRQRGSRENEREIQAFLNDEKQILVFTEGAGGVGVSFHSDIRFKNQRPRVHIFFEMSWRAEGAIQGMGRTHRTGQVAPPLYVFASTNVDGEKRFSSTPARKIATLGALSRGQREAADNGLFRAEDNLEGRFGRIALKQLLDDVRNHRIATISRERLYDQTGIDACNNDLEKRSKFKALTVARFLNRLLTCDIADDGGFQRELMDAFIERMDLAIDEAKAAGTFDAGVETFQPDHLRILHRTTINVTPSGAKTEVVELEAKEFPRNRLTFEQIVAKRDGYATFMKAPPHFAKDKDGRVGLYVPVQHKSPTEKQMMRIIGVTGERLVDAESAMRATVLNDTAAEKAWQAAYDSVTMEVWTITAVTGALTPVWMQLPWQNPRIIRAQTDDGERLLMRHIPRTERKALYEKFGLVPISLAA